MQIWVHRFTKPLLLGCSLGTCIFRFVVAVVQLLSHIWLCDPMDYSPTGSSILHSLPESANIHVHWVGDLPNHLILCHSLVLLPSVFPIIRVFSNEYALCIRCLEIISCCHILQKFLFFKDWIICHCICKPSFHLFICPWKFRLLPVYEIGLQYYE